jgi:3-oxoacyl-[acyl-carrier-protein] synthase III
MSKRPVIDAVGTYLPPTIETTRAFETRLPGDFAPGWIEATTGVRQRQVAPPDLEGADHSVRGNVDILKRASVEPD